MQAKFLHVCMRASLCGIVPPAVVEWMGFICFLSFKLPAGPPGSAVLDAWSKCPALGSD